MTDLKCFLICVFGLFFFGFGALFLAGNEYEIERTEGHSHNVAYLITGCFFLTLGSLMALCSCPVVIYRLFKKSQETQDQEVINNGIELATRLETGNEIINPTSEENLDLEIANLEKKRKIAELRKEIRDLEASQAASSTSVV